MISFMIVTWPERQLAGVFDASSIRPDGGKLTLRDIMEMLDAEVLGFVRNDIKRGLKEIGAHA